ncbi:AMP-binding protein [Arthrobacter sp. NPDC089319]|uniref:AMP-binding protein n=1 Tax=Arthrobacter sp. NPDC089319 TaxID=3155915 RepID=UPI00341AC153
MLLKNVTERADELYVIDGAVRLTVADIAREAARWQKLLQRHGVAEGDVVLVQLPNRWEIIAILHAIWGLGAIANPVTPIYRGHELGVILSLWNPKVIIAADQSAALAQATVSSHAGEEAPVVLDLTTTNIPDAPPPFARVPLNQDAIALLMYTSGTTGRPKGVLHTHATLIGESTSLDTVFGLEGERVFMPSPLTHITGLLYGVLMPLITRSLVVLQDRWDPLVAMRVIEQEECDMTVGATPFLQGLAEAYGEFERTSHLRLFICGGADIPASLVEIAETKMKTQVARTYGSTEIPTLCTVHPHSETKVRMHTEGHPIGANRARLVSVRDGVGSLEVHGPELFVGYADAADNASAFAHDGWFRTGDLARIDEDGSITIVGREKDIIVRGGENISAKEVEDLLVQHPAIRDVAVVGFADTLMGERACAVVVADGRINLQEITRHLASFDLAVQKYPEALLAVEALPRTPSGKVQKHILRELLVGSPALEIRSLPRKKMT